MKKMTTLRNLSLSRLVGTSLVVALLALGSFQSVSAQQTPPPPPGMTSPPPPPPPMQPRRPMVKPPKKAPVRFNTQPPRAPQPGPGGNSQPGRPQPGPAPR